MFCEEPQPLGRISLTLNCGLDSASVAGSEIEPIEGGFQMRTPWAFKPGEIVVMAFECVGCTRCQNPVEILIADCRAGEAKRSGYLTTFLFLDTIGSRCTSDPASPEPPLHSRGR